MNKILSTSGLVFCLTIFIGLMPLAFTFSKNGTQLLLETSLNYLVWSGQAIILLLLLVTKPNFSKNQLIGLAALFMLVPFAFTFNENEAYFLILNKYTSSILSWVISSVFLSKLLFSEKLKVNSNI
ncbi:MAG: hypothetical protein KKF62_04070 [Bacteroidetes bacterium]|nr:hypothetical protein [Bacteroidota bacterium]MBU1117215.1 hypothetical protein [Bacteroidota bacterium]MBU1800137.1 hypothetical protein [Bacteroidota bacterium]